MLESVHRALVFADVGSCKGILYFWLSKLDRSWDRLVSTPLEPKIIGS
jgi:hypothetical protein